LAFLSAILYPASFRSRIFWTAEDKNFSRQMALNPPKWAKILINLFLLVQKRVRKLMGVAINRYPGSILII
jgi:hypothetical protein